MCQILFFNAINTIVTDMECNVRIDRLLLGRGTDHEPWAVCVSSYCLHISNYYINSWRTQMGQSKMDNSEKLATLGTQAEDKQNKITTQYVLDITMRKQTQIK